MKLNVKAFALACGIIWGLGLFAITWWMIAFDGQTGRPYMLGHIYRGWRVDALGSLWGLLWGLFDGLVGGAVFAWLYNCLLPKPKTSDTGEHDGPAEPA